MRNDLNAFSDVVGSIALVAVSVAAFGGLAALVYDEIETKPQPPHSDFRILSAGEEYVVIPSWGEPMQLDDSIAIVRVDGVPTPVKMSELAVFIDQGVAGTPELWDVGEPLRLGCAAGASCKYPGRTIGDFALVHGGSNALVYSAAASIRGAGASVAAGGAQVSSLGDLHIKVEVAGAGRVFDGDSIRFRATVTNSGLAPLDFSVAQVRFFVDGATAPIYTGTVAGPLTMGQSVLVETSPWAATLGERRITAKVDESNTIVEATKENNAARFEFTVNPRLPDLVASFVSMTPASPREDDYVTFTVRVQNLGAASITKKSTVQFEVGGKKIKEYLHPTLLPGEERLVTSGKWKAHEGNQVLTVTVDSKGEVSEVDENDNWFTRGFVVGEERDDDDDGDNGHGNDDDGCDESNPAHGDDCDD